MLSAKHAEHIVYEMKSAIHQDINIMDSRGIIIASTNPTRCGTLHQGALECAQLRAEEAKKSFSHTRPNGTACFTALKEAGIDYMAAGENLAGKIKTPEKVVKAWMDSPGHRKNIMDPRFTQIGVGYVAEGNYWSQFFLG